MNLVPISEREGVWQLPASVTPLLRFPLFGISFHNLPLRLYCFLANRVIKKDGYLNVYFHPWEFVDIGPKSKYNFPFYVTRNTDKKMVDRFDQFIKWAGKMGYKFYRTYDFIKTIEK